MKRVSIYIILFLVTMGNINAQQTDSLFAFNDSSRTIKRPWRAAFHALGLNAGVWAYNRFVDKAEYAKISFHSIGDNIKRGFLWDNDLFTSNMLLHPYHGSLNYSIARSNGLTFWESAPYPFIGSLAWEVCAETTPPSINDLFTTSFGGIALGEVSYRLSSLVLDNSKRGGSRFFREFLGTVISPARGFNRLITGDAWKVSHKYYEHHNNEKLPIKFVATVGDRYMAYGNSLFKEGNSPYMEFHLIYGDILQDGMSKPFDYFKFISVLNLDGSQPFVGSLSLTAKLLGKYLEPFPGNKLLIGFFQHFDYYNSRLNINGSKKIPFKISEPAALGLGIIYQLPVAKTVNIQQHVYLNGILLGACLTDHYNLGRDYNMGSGYSIKSNTTVNFGKYGNLELNVHHFRIFTWKGYQENDFENTSSAYLYLNTQGDKGNVSFTILNSRMSLNLGSNIILNAGLYYYLRNTHYAHYEDVFSRTSEVRLGLGYSF